MGRGTCGSNDDPAAVLIGEWRIGDVESDKGVDNPSGGTTLDEVTSWGIALNVEVVGIEGNEGGREGGKV